MPSADRAAPRAGAAPPCASLRVSEQARISARFHPKLRRAAGRQHTDPVLVSTRDVGCRALVVYALSVQFSENSRRISEPLVLDGTGRLYNRHTPDRRVTCTTKHVVS